MLAMTLLSPALTLGASVPYSYESSVSSGFVQNPNEHKRVGYITKFQMGTNPNAFNADLKVAIPYQASVSPAYSGLVTSLKGSPASAKAAPVNNTAQVVGVIQKFEWAGGVGDPIQITFLVSQENAYKIKTLMQQTLVATKVNQLGWWIADYDQETKQWYEQSYPKSSPTITGIIANKGNPDLDVNLTPIPLGNGASVYKVTMRLAPAANTQYALHFANSSTRPVAKSWGLVVGNLSKLPYGN